MGETARAVTAGFGSRTAGRAASRLRRLLSRPSVYGALIPVAYGLNAVAGLALPMLMTPATFAGYALVVTFFQYGLIFDLGASQLADRILPARLGRREEDAAEAFGQQLLWVRLYVAVATFALAAAVMTGLAAAGRLAVDLPAALLSVLAGLAYMVALGPVAIHRARSDRRRYALATTILSSGLIVARLGGLVVAGVVGCFAALAAWYAGWAAILLGRMPPRRAMQPSLGQTLDLAMRGLPLFATSFLAAFYLTANRWIAAAAISQTDFALFAFGANVLALLAGGASGLGAMWYPAVLQALARNGAGSGSRRAARDLCLLLAVAALAAICGAAATRLGIALLFPHFIEAVPAVRAFLTALPALTLASWLMPLSLSAGRRPWIDGVLVYPVAISLLILGIPILYARLGIEGAAYASTASGLALTAMQAVLLVNAAVLSIRAAAAIEAVALLVTAAVGGFVWVLA